MEGAGSKFTLWENAGEMSQGVVWLQVLEKEFLG